ncbi:cobalamin-binding protein [Janibacter melonis]|uniref:Cobalamin-binding protein n=1 Tax=Janibacter melonis TaxID=262209 RepID=A0A176QCD9_9MICO|nr:helical backbone metal receptor [Janibacter melonis]OAB87437.1 cobalamin-binding protein [Janibacter melonis]
MTRSLTDDLGTVLDLPDAPTRVVSLVPSLTEAVAATAPGLLIGATDWCTHPTDLDVARVRGTKNPDLAAVRALSPDLVVANKEENRELDVRRLRESGVAVWVTDIETVPEALASMRRLITGPLALDAPTWLDEADELWGGPPPPVRDRVAVPIWRDPWMVVGPRTYTTDLLRRLGHDNPFAHGTARYPAVEITQVDADGVDEVWLPDEPYVFTEEDGPEAFTRTPARLVSGRLLTWYGPAMVQAHHELA